MVDQFSNTHIGIPAQKAVSDYLCDRLSGVGFTGFDATPYRDHDNMDALRVTLSFDYVAEPLDPQLFSGLVTDIYLLLQQNGEKRFPYLTYNFDERQKIMAA
jgi:hypothetical protein